MHIVLVNVPFRDPRNSEKWITVPPRGYGGIQWLVATLADAYLAAGHAVSVLGAPGSPVNGPMHQVPDVATMEQAKDWIMSTKFDIVHDHSNGQIFESSWTKNFVSTHSLTGRPKIERNCVFVSEAQRASAGMPAAPVIRVPVNLDRYKYCSEKKDYLLFLGRVSPWKGTLEAAQFASKAGLPLLIAGPTWEARYRDAVEACYGDCVKWLGEICGERRLKILAGARAVLVLSQPLMGPWSDIWCEPGATVVSEAAACGTPVIATDNGCLAEIAPRVGVVIPCGVSLGTEDAAEVLARLPSPASVRSVAEDEWDSSKIGQKYLKLFGEVRNGFGW